MKAHSTLSGALSFIPLGGYALLICFAALAYVQVGHWPVYGRPDPKDVGPLFFGELFRLSIALAAMLFSASFCGDGLA